MLLCDSDGIFTKVVVISLLAITVCSGCLPKEKDAKEEAEVPRGEEINLLSLISVQVPGWHEEETVLISKREDMFEYMDGEVELYFAYGFRRLAVKKYKNGESLPMLVEVYEFDKSENAYGIYSFDTVGDKRDIGQDAVYGHGLLKFWKDRVLVRVLAEERYRELEEDVFSFGKQIDSKILTAGTKPHLLSLVPEGKLVPDSLHFFHRNICLNNIYYIPESTALGLSDQTDVVTARYALEEKQTPALFLLIEYPSESGARTAFEKFSALYFRGESISADRQNNVIKVAEWEYNSIALNRNFVILIFEARYPEFCKRLVIATLTKIDLYGEAVG